MSLGMAPAIFSEEERAPTICSNSGLLAAYVDKGNVSREVRIAGFFCTDVRSPRWDYELLGLTLDRHSQVICRRRSRT